MAFAVFAEIAPVIGVISGGFSIASACKNLFFSESAFSLDDVSREINSSNAHYFEGDNLSVLKTRRDSFYAVIKQTILDSENKSAIVKSDLQSGGRLYDVYTNLKAYRGDVNDILAKLTWLWSSNDLHVDDLTRFVRIFTDAYALLLHMQAVYTQLHRIEMGCDSLSDDKLISDTLQARLYLCNAIEALSGIRAKTKGDRFALIQTGFTTSLSGGYYWYNDTYTPQSNSTGESELSPTKATSDRPDYNPHGEAWWDIAWEKMNNDDEGTIDWNASVRAGQVCYMFDTLGGDDALVALRAWRDLNQTLEDRLAEQLSNSTARILVPSTETMLAQNVTTLYYRQGDQALYAICETSLLKAEWVQIGGSKSSTSEASIKMQRVACPSVKESIVDDCIFWSDSDDSDYSDPSSQTQSYTYSYETGFSIQGDDYHWQERTVRNAKLRENADGMTIKFGDECKTFNSTDLTTAVRMLPALTE